MRLKLTIDPIPISSWGISLASKLGKKKWDELRHKVYFEADYACSACGQVNEELHCHEQWVFKKTSRTEGIQSLAGFVCLCKTCHNCAHLGRSMEVYDKEYVEKLMRHMEKVNGISRSQLLKYIYKIRGLNYKRAQVFWRIKIGNMEII